MRAAGDGYYTGRAGSPRFCERPHASQCTGGAVTIGPSVARRPSSRAPGWLKLALLSADLVGTRQKIWDCRGSFGWLPDLCYWEIRLVKGLPRQALCLLAASQQ